MKILKVAGLALVASYLVWLSVLTAAGWRRRGKKQPRYGATLLPLVLRSSPPWATFL